MMHQRGRAVLGVLAAVVSLLLPFSSPGANAQDNRLSITTSPLPISLTAKPGETISTDLRVRSDGPQNENLQITLLKFSASNTDGQPRLADREPGDDYFDWVSFSETRFVSEPNVWKTIKMTIATPSTSGLGYYYAVAFTRAGETPESSQGAGVAGGAATLVLLDVRTPNARRAVDVIEFTSKQKVYEFLPAEFTVSVKNTGNIHLVPSGEIFIKKGEENLATLKVNKTNGNVLPASQRNFTVLWEDGYPSFKQKEQDGKVVNDKDGNPLRALSWSGLELSKLRIGKFTANLLMVYDDGERDVPIEAVLSFWVIPWRILAVIFAVVGLVGFAVFVIVRKIWKKARGLAARRHAH